MTPDPKPGHLRSARLVVPLLVGALIGAAAVAATPDSRGWSEGTPARNATRVLSPLPEKITLKLPSDLLARLDGPTLLVYFSPTCHHCVAVAPELAALSERIAGRADVIGVATGRTTQAQLDTFTAKVGWKFPVVIDTDGAIGTAMAVKSTPSAVLVTPEKRSAVIVDFWYPYSRGYDTLVAMRVLDTPFQAFVPGEYQGNDLCAACHVDEADAWALTHHAAAWHFLDRSGKTGDPECTGCHVTGAGAPTGWDGTAESPLVDVGCEACHGPGGPHDGTATDARAQCAACHDDAHSIVFDVDQAVPHLDHYRAVGMPPREWQDLREKLFDGEIPRAMLAFPPGPTVGAAACATCHAEPHATWTVGVHAGAMDTLPEGKRDDVACVSCHATPLVSGPLPTTLAGFRTTEGVGCESCHGPGEAHVASAGAPGTIEGLGDDCPVCVIEAICTTCHTPEQDPDWDLGVALPLAGHAAPKYSGPPSR